MCRYGTPRFSGVWNGTHCKRGFVLTSKARAASSPFAVSGRANGGSSPDPGAMPAPPGRRRAGCQMPKTDCARGRAASNGRVGGDEREHRAVILQHRLEQSVAACAVAVRQGAHRHAVAGLQRSFGPPAARERRRCLSLDLPLVRRPIGFADRDNDEGMRIHPAETDYFTLQRQRLVQETGARVVGRMPVPRRRQAGQGSSACAHEVPSSEIPGADLASFHAHRRACRAGRDQSTIKRGHGCASFPSDGARSAAISTCAGSSIAARNNSRSCCRFSAKRSRNAKSSSTS